MERKKHIQVLFRKQNPTFIWIGIWSKGDKNPECFLVLWLDCLDELL